MKRLLIALLLSACAYAQNPASAVYPSSVAADADLTVACSRVNTTTTGSLTNVATSVAVADATGLLNGCTIAIGSEDLLICGISGTTLSFGKSACPNVDGRGLDGSGAVPHASGSRVVGNITRLSHNALAAEIKAIETNAAKVTSVDNTWTCQSGFGDGANTLPQATYTQLVCINDSPRTWTISTIRCWSNNSGSSTLNATNGAGTSLLTGAITCSTSYPTGTKSATVTIPPGDKINITFIADGTTNSVSFAISGTK